MKTNEDNNIVQYDILRDTALFYHNNLRNNNHNTAAISKIHSWGIYGSNVVKLGLGFADKRYDALFIFLVTEKGYKIQDVLKLNLVYKGKQGNFIDRIRNAIVIPVINEKGQVVSLLNYSLYNQTLYRSIKAEGFDFNSEFYSINIALKNNNKSVMIVTEPELYRILFVNGIKNVILPLNRRIRDKHILKTCKSFKKVIVYVSRKNEFLKGINDSDIAKKVEIQLYTDMDEVKTYISENGTDLFFDLLN